MKGALHVPRGFLEFRADPSSPSHDPAFEPGRTVILYCASGGRAALAGKTLRDLGYADVRNLGGFKDWAAAGGEVEQAGSPHMVSGGQQNADKAAEAAPGPRKPGEDLQRRQDQLLDQALQETFPASDPISPKVIV
ncbi:rhodanese-like domain-containing protein [Roseomonas xinghualingensis]|uniref:rhodanese-like domain-containing protein n=1 Tax=Roseomonas xinghualingensis TaxID=2986475 RepID=UPI0021F178D7|nr:rhodanese-like domain-containing protein [Roseomonas sp. SXEYE001]MCV4210015.1 rhodanese-like domain-containing protein [Roseomonas sp. SXEYE001]